MKKLLSLLLIFTALAALVGCGAWEPDMTSESWELEHALAADESGKQRVVCGSEAFLASGRYPDAETVAFSLRAKGGKIEIRNDADGTTYLGTCDDGEVLTPEQTVYALRFGARAGSAVAELYTDVATEKTEKLLTVTLGGYTMVFTAR